MREPKYAVEEKPQYAIEYLPLHQYIDPWAGCGFNSKLNHIEFHRREDGTAWLNMTITEFKGKSDRMYEMVGEMSFTPEQARKIAKFLLKYSEEA